MISKDEWIAYSVSFGERSRVERFNTIADADVKLRCPGPSINAPYHAWLWDSKADRERGDPADGWVTCVCRHCEKQIQVDVDAEDLPEV